MQFGWPLVNLWTKEDILPGSIHHAIISTSSTEILKNMAYIASLSPHSNHVTSSKRVRVSRKKKSTERWRSYTHSFVECLLREVTWLPIWTHHHTQKHSKWYIEMVCFSIPGRVPCWPVFMVWINAVLRHKGYLLDAVKCDAKHGHLSQIKKWWWKMEEWEITFW